MPSCQNPSSTTTRPKFLPSAFGTWNRISCAANTTSAFLAGAFCA